MPSMDISIVKRGTEPPWSDVTDPIIVPPEEPWRVVILEGGMASGEPSVALRLDFPTGLGGSASILAETSLSALVGVLAAARGAFPEAFVGGPFEEKR